MSDYCIENDGARQLEMAAIERANAERRANLPATDAPEILNKLHKSLGGIKVPEVMHGDNLSIILCTAFEDDGEIQESGWTLSAEDGCEKTLQAIRDHYDRATDLPATDAQAMANPKVQALVDSANSLNRYANAAWLSMPDNQIALELMEAMDKMEDVLAAL